MLRVIFLLAALIMSPTIFAGPIYQTIINENPSANVPTSHVPKETQGVTIQEQLGNTIDLNLEFIDENNQKIKLSDYLADGKPVILTFNYYRCKTLCGLQLTNLAQTMRKLTSMPIGKDFKILTISFDPTDTPALAKEKQSMYMEMTGQKSDQWHFLVGTQGNIDTITQQIGFFYKYLPEKNEFSHTAAIFFISPKGLISRYLYGITYKENDIKFALMDASEGKIGTTLDKILLFCCNYDPNAGQYTGLAIGFMRVVATVTILFVLSLVFIFSRRRKKAPSL